MRAFLSIATRDHLFLTETLGEGLAAHAPTTPHLILVPDATADEPKAGHATNVGFATVVPDQRLRDALAFRYSPFELCCALKPFFAAWALRAGHTEVIYLDSDMELTAALPEDAWPGAASLQLTPHCLTPQPAALERKFLRHGVFNAGYFAARATRGGLAALDHWAAQCTEHAHDDPEHGMFVDQLWLNLAPTLFPADVAVSRSRLINVGYWNFHERSLDEVALFHWSRARVSPFGEEHRVVWSPELAARIDARVAAYLRRLAGAAERAPRAAPAFGAFTDGRPITWLDRREFSRGALRGIERPFARADAFAEAAHERTRAARRARLATWRRRLLGI